MTTNIKSMNDESLLKEIKNLAAEERKLTAQLLLFLREVDRRRLFAKQGYGSLFEYVTRELGYSDASAQRRIASMRVLKELPEVEEKIISGALNLSHVAQAQRFFRNEVKNAQPVTLEQKREVLLSLEGKSTREAERELISRSSNPEQFLQRDQVRPVSQSLSQVSFVADQEFLEQLEHIRGLLAHSKPNASMLEIMKEMAKLTIAKLEAKKFAQVDKPRVDKSEAGKTGSQDPAAPTQSSGAGVETGAKGKTTPSRTISAETKRQVYQRDSGQCSYVDIKTKTRCTSKYALEFDHLKSFAKNGETAVDNLALRC